MLVKTGEKSFVPICSRLTIFFPKIDSPNGVHFVEKGQSC